MKLFQNISIFIYITLIIKLLQYHSFFLISLKFIFCSSTSFFRSSILRSSLGTFLRISSLCLSSSSFWSLSFLVIALRRRKFDLSILTDNIIRNGNSYLKPSRILRICLIHWHLLPSHSFVSQEFCPLFAWALI